MSHLPVVKVIKPSDLAGQSNGEIDKSLRRAIDGGGELHHIAARAWDALVVNAWAHANMALTFTSIHDTYRSLFQQTSLFERRYAIGGKGGGCKTWNRKKWCKKDSKLATAATPGRSVHGLGLAIDAAFDRNPDDGFGPNDATYIVGHPGWQWLLANAHRFGFSWELQSEPWHMHYFAGDLIPQAVLDWEAFYAGIVAEEGGAPDPAPAPAPPTDPGPAPVDPPTDGGTKMKWLDEIKKGAWSNSVTIMQTLLWSLGYSIQPDGVFGNQTDATVRQFQGRHDLKVDGMVGPKTWNALASDGPRAGEFDRG